MLRAFRLAGPLAALAIGAATLAGCTAPGLILTAAGIATDTSMTWEMVKHVHAQLTEDDPTPCALLNSVQRALNGRCEFVPGSIRTIDVFRSGLQACPLTAATRDARLWRALPELIEKGASYERCARSPLQDLAEIDACPNFQAASPEILKAMVHLADNDPRSVRHDVFRMLSCRNARAVGLDQVLVGWLDRGKLQPGTLSFSPLEALDPDVLVTRFGRELEVAGHLPSAALDHYDGSLPMGFEEALRTSHWAALEWWFYELPQLANRAPPSRGAQMAWVPLQRVLLPGYLVNPDNPGRHRSLPHGARCRSAHQAALRSGQERDRLRRRDQEPDGRAARRARPARRAVPVPSTTLAQTATGDEAGRAAGVSRPARQAARFDPKSPTNDTTPR